MNFTTHEPQPPWWLEIASVLLVPAATVGFARVFLTLDPLLPIAGAALLSSAVAVLCRRLGLPLFLAGPISAALLGALIMNRYAPGTARYGLIPTGETISALRLQLTDLVENFQELKTPVPALEPFVAAAMVGAWIMAFLTDWGAMRLRLAFEPVLPSALLFVFTSIPPVSAGTNRVQATLAFAAAVALWAVCQRISAIRERGVWLANDRNHGPNALARGAFILATVAVLVGALVGQRLPWAQDEPMYSFASQQDSTRLVVSPYVRLYSRLVEQSNQEMFTVAADAPAYWRMAGLDSFEQNIWKLAGDFSKEGGELPTTSELGGQRTELEQTYEITSLAAIWLPAAFPPTEIVDSNNDMTWHADTSTLTVDGSTASGDGVVYTIKSQVGTFDADELAAATDVVPANIAERYLDTPTLPTILKTTAEEVTAGQTTRYGQMVALQDFFRTEFDYEVSLSPATGDPITQFLTEREGFCQQFAGVFALMARELGAPARVATGFTWGTPTGINAKGQTIYRITGAQTHAWPEVYFSGYGWVAFEPTPGRGIPNAAYTGHEAEQASIEQPDLGGSDLALPPTTLPDDSFLLEENLDDLELGEPVIDGGFDIPWRTVLPVLAVLAYLAGMPALRRALRMRRRAGVETDADLVEVSWAEATEALEMGFDLSRTPSETRTEFAGRLRSEGSVGAQPVSQLAELATAARFHPTGVDGDDAQKADGLARQVDEAVRHAVPGHQRYLKELIPTGLPRQNGASKSKT